MTTKPANYFLGLEIHHFEDGSIKINQQAYMKRILEKFHMEKCKPVSTPMIKQNLNTEKSGENNEIFPYREAVNNLIIGTRPDLAYCVGVLSHHLENPSRGDWMRVKHVFRYIAGSSEKGIMYKHNYKSESLKCYSDADFGECTESGKSTTGIVILYSGGAISWFSQRQTVVVTSNY